MNLQLLDLYTDYLLSSFGAATATGLSRIVDGAISHDQITRMWVNRPVRALSRQEIVPLGGDRQGSVQLWRKVKATVRKIQREEGVLILDDSTLEKPYTDENDIVAWHYDHSKGRMVKGINFVSLLYHSQGLPLPVGYVLVEKTEVYVDQKSGQGGRCFGTASAGEGLTRCVGSGSAKPGHSDLSAPLQSRAANGGAGVAPGERGGGEPVLPGAGGDDGGRGPETLRRYILW